MRYPGAWEGVEIGMGNILAGEFATGVGTQFPYSRPRMLPSHAAGLRNANATLPSCRKRPIGLAIRRAQLALGRNSVVVRIEVERCQKDVRGRRTSGLGR